MSTIGLSVAIPNNTQPQNGSHAPSNVLQDIIEQVKLLSNEQRLHLIQHIIGTVLQSTSSTPHKGSAQAVLQLAGTLHPHEAEALRDTVAEMRQIDADLWE